MRKIIIIIEFGAKCLGAIASAFEPLIPAHRDMKAKLKILKDEEEAEAIIQEGTLTKSEEVNNQQTKQVLS